MKIYTKTGDKGETSLFGGKRVPKDALRIETYGTVDELNSLIGVIRATNANKRLDRILEKIQDDLFVLGADLASPTVKNPKPSAVPRIEKSNISALEKSIDWIEPKLRPLRKFILPGGTLTASYLHLARSVCRRAERLAVRLARTESISPQILVYVNRLSDLLFILARWVNHRAGVREIVWKR